MTKKYFIVVSNTGNSPLIIPNDIKHTVSRGKRTETGKDEKGNMTYSDKLEIVVETDDIKKTVRQLAVLGFGVSNPQKIKEFETK